MLVLYLVVFCCSRCGWRKASTWVATCVPVFSACHDTHCTSYIEIFNHKINHNMFLLEEIRQGLKAQLYPYDAFLFPNVFNQLRFLALHTHSHAHLTPLLPFCYCTWYLYAFFSSVCSNFFWIIVCPFSNTYYIDTWYKYVCMIIYSTNFSLLQYSDSHETCISPLVSLRKEPGPPTQTKTNKKSSRNNSTPYFMWLSQPKLAIFVLHWWISLSTSRTSGIEHSICLGRVILTYFNMFRFHRWLSGFDASLKKCSDNMLQSFHGTDCSTEFHRPLNSRELSCLACAVSAALQCRCVDLQMPSNARIYLCYLYFISHFSTI